MPFTLEQIITGDADTFTSKDLLEILGDPINDEIIIRGTTYRLSSFAASGEGEFTVPEIMIQTQEFIINEENDNHFTIPESFSNMDKLILTLNGVIYRYGIPKDFHVIHGDLIWHGPIDLTVGDSLVVRYWGYEV